MGTRTQNAAKTPEMPRETTFEEMEKLTRPDTAQEAFKDAAAVAPPVTGTSSVTITQDVSQATVQGTLTINETEETPAPLEDLLALESKALNTTALGAAGLAGVDRVSELRMEMEAKISHLMAQISELKTQHSGPKVEGDVILAKLRGTMYCPECDVMLHGGANTAMANTPYSHPMGSAAPKPCSLQGVRFDNAYVFLKKLAAVPFKKALPA